MRTETTAGNGSILHRYLDEDIFVLLLLTHSWCSGENPRIWFSRVHRCRFSLGNINSGAALEYRGSRWRGSNLHGTLVEMSSHGGPTCPTLCRACSACATHDTSFRVFTSRWTSAGRWSRWVPWWCRRMAGIAKIIRISLLMMSQRFDNDAGFQNVSMFCG